VFKGVFKMQSNTHSTLHTRALKWNHIGRRSNNGGMFAWAKRELKNKTKKAQRQTPIEWVEWATEQQQDRAHEVVRRYYAEWGALLAAFDEV
jgi:hypothetical protein